MVMVMEIVMYERSEELLSCSPSPPASQVGHHCIVTGIDVHNQVELLCQQGRKFSASKVVFFVRLQVQSAGCVPHCVVVLSFFTHQPLMLPQAAQRLSEALAEAPGMEEGEKVVEMKQHVIQLNRQLTPNK